MLWMHSPSGAGVPHLPVVALLLCPSEHSHSCGELNQPGPSLCLGSVCLVWSEICLLTNKAQAVGNLWFLLCLYAEAAAWTRAQAGLCWGLLVTGPGRAARCCHIGGATPGYWGALLAAPPLHTRAIFTCFSQSCVQGCGSLQGPRALFTPRRSGLLPAPSLRAAWHHALAQPKCVCSCITARLQAVLSLRRLRIRSGNSEFSHCHRHTHAEVQKAQRCTGKALGMAVALPE